MNKYLDSILEELHKAMNGLQGKPVYDQACFIKGASNTVILYSQCQLVNPGCFWMSREPKAVRSGLSGIPVLLGNNIQRTGKTVTSSDKEYLLDIVGSYTVTINGRSFDCVCVMDVESADFDVVSEQYFDVDRQTVLWRKFSCDDWAGDRYKKTWSKQLPENEQLPVNGKTYVHWCDCITDYVLGKGAVLRKCSV